MADKGPFRNPPAGQFFFKKNGEKTRGFLKPWRCDWKKAGGFLKAWRPRKKNAEPAGRFWARAVGSTPFFCRPAAFGEKHHFPLSWTAGPRFFHADRREV